MCSELRAQAEECSKLQEQRNDEAERAQKLELVRCEFSQALRCAACGDHQGELTLALVPCGHSICGKYECPATQAGSCTQCAKPIQDRVKLFILSALTVQRADKGERHEDMRRHRKGQEQGCSSVGSEDKGDAQGEDGPEVVEMQADMEMQAGRQAAEEERGDKGGEARGEKRRMAEMVHALPAERWCLAVTELLHASMGSAFELHATLGHLLSRKAALNPNAGT